LSLKAEGKTIFLSSHILSEIEHVCDRIIIIDRGRLLRIGSMQEMLAERSHVQIIVDHVPESLEGTLIERGASITRDGDAIHIVIDAAQRRAVVETLSAGGCDVLSLTPMKSSLEEVFLKVVAGGAE
jgi:ABC-2 type transport system ATP-binding protein